MDGIKHLLVFIAGMIGLFAGMVLIDLDHSGGLKTLWKNFFGVNPEYPTQKGWLHKDLLPLAVFSLMLGIGLLIHYIMDFGG